MMLEQKCLDELGTISRGKSKYRPRNDPSLFNGKYPFIQTADVKNANFYITEFSQTYNEKGLSQSKLWQKGTLCITIAANIADTGILGIDACFPDSIMGFVPYEDKSDVRYVKYCFDILQKQCQQISQGATQDNLSWEKLSTIKFPVPPLEKQRRIADILSAYDDLIENNQKQIKLLEEAAQRLYKEWFVNFRFPGYENTPIIDGVPQGWRKMPLGELIEYEIGGGWGEDQPTEKCDLPAYVIRGTDLYDVTHGNAKGIPYRFHSKSNLDSRKLQDGDIVFEVSGGSKNEGVARTALITKSLLDFLGNDVICASFCKLIRLKDKSLAKYMYDTFQYLRNSGETIKYDKRSASSIVNYRWKDFLEQQFIFVPPMYILAQYNSLAENMQKANVNKAQIIEQAKQARDRLLPKLMSGELEV